MVRSRNHFAMKTR